MKFIHAADLHLDSPFRGLSDLPAAVKQRVYQAPFTATQRLVDRAIQERVDFVVLVGDLFDRDTQSVQAQLFLRDQLQRLVDTGIGVYLSYGNHDYLTEQSTLSLPDGVTVFGREVTTAEFTTATQQRVAISGFSYDQRWLTTDRVAEFPDRSEVDFQIGMLHGAVRTGAQDQYAPFTVAELQAKRYDYWALGHIHQQQALSMTPPIIYAGAIQGRHQNETGTHGFQLVESSGQRLRPTYIPADDVTWLTLSVPAESGMTDDTLQTAVLMRLAQLPTTQLQLVTLAITNVEALNEGVLSRLNDGTWLARLNHTQAGQSPITTWVVEVTPQPSEATIQYSQLDAAFWDDAAQTVFDSTIIETTAGKLMQYPFLARHLQDTDTQTKIQQRVRSSLLAQSRLEATQRADHDD
ncbi:metallophosphoesterase family protein [Secundilactobacillus similis]|uniref:Metallophosphoesterase n=1 Tax=Secundilactobacillus similis DSM 23365 = JCM 2765 TaxID=1423804 RepID=A0A0R2EZA2_9LACO|nr:DNA repair exonuclease [Secundilactobacillus similis]KRN17756.1 metallophosphoesterase [Secundilactobacillus similis DSM 23365 = JCM 2765]